MSRINRIREGFRHIRLGFQFFGKEKRLWPYAVIPTVINLIVLIVMIVILAEYYGSLTSWIFGSGSPLQSDAGFLAVLYHYTIHTLIYVIKFLLFLVLLVLIFILTFVFSMIITGPFNDTISEVTEKIITGNEIKFSFKHFTSSIWRTIVVELQKACVFLTVPILLLFLNLVPGIGNTLYLILAGIFAAFDIGFNFLDYTMSRKLWKFGDRFGLAWRNKYELLGFGAVALIPFFPYIFAAPMVVGGTMLFLNLNNCSGRTPDRPL